MFDVLKDGDEEGGGDGDRAGQQHPGKTGPPQVQEALQKKTEQLLGENSKQTSSAAGRGGLRVGLKADLVERHIREFYGASNKSCVSEEGESSI